MGGLLINFHLGLVGGGLEVFLIEGEGNVDEGSSKALLDLSKEAEEEEELWWSNEKQIKE